jgi:hypothetical protein
VIKHGWEILERNGGQNSSENLWGIFQHAMFDWMFSITVFRSQQQDSLWSTYKKLWKMAH